MRSPLLLVLAVAAIALAVCAVGGHELSEQIGRAFANFSVSQ